jgi:hypothetical protein
LAYKKTHEERASEASHLGYGYDRDLSGDDYAVFVKPGQGAVIAYRGTDPRNIQDLSADAAIALKLQKYHPRFKKAIEASKKAKQKYGSISLTGHSLGGALAEHVNSYTDDTAYTYNPGKSPFMAGLFSQKKRKHNVFEFRNNNDFISSGKPMDTFSTLYGISNNAHGVQQFF